MSAVLEFAPRPVQELDPPMRTWSITYVDREKPKRAVTLEIQNQYLSFACSEAQSRARVELGTDSVVLRQDHPFYKSQRKARR